MIGLPDDDLGNRVHAIVQTDDGTPIDEDELRAFLAERLVRYKIPRTFEFVGEPLRDDAGKLRRSALRADWLLDVCPLRDPPTECVGRSAMNGSARCESDERDDSVHLRGVAPVVRERGEDVVCERPEALLLGFVVDHARVDGDATEHDVRVSTQVVEPGRVVRAAGVRRRATTTCSPSWK